MNNFFYNCIFLINDFQFLLDADHVPKYIDDIDNMNKSQIDIFWLCQQLYTRYVTLTEMDFTNFFINFFQIFSYIQTLLNLKVFYIVVLTRWSRPCW